MAGKNEVHKVAVPKLQPPVNTTGTNKSTTRNASEVDLKNAVRLRCVHCGAETLRPKDKFLRSPYSSVYEKSDHYVPICKQCMRAIYKDLLNRYNKDVCFVIMVCCQLLDWPFDPGFARQARDAEPAFPLPDYFVRISVSRYKGQVFADTLKPFYDNPLLSVGARQKQEKEWDRESVQNMQYIKNICGYDPFDDEAFTSGDRKFLFNTMAGYCPDSSIGSDSHKFQTIQNIVRLQLQVSKINQQLTEALAQVPVNPDTVNDFTKIQKDIYASINAMAKENGISSTGSKSANTLTERMKLLMDDRFDDIEVNMFNINQSAIIQQVSDISVQSIFKELKFESHDYSDIITQQLEIIAKQEKELSKLREENRLLQNAEILKEIEEEKYSGG